MKRGCKVRNSLEIQVFLIFLVKFSNRWWQCPEFLHHEEGVKGRTRWKAVVPCDSWHMDHGWSAEEQKLTLSQAPCWMFNPIQSSSHLRDLLFFASGHNWTALKRWTFGHQGNRKLHIMAKCGCAGSALSNSRGLSPIVV